ncbi:hypothetical protein BHM03_00025100 [Ensete ventricosum]|nr:hypothetical protein BHM03_00025100 [Ensete ventricosum]
MISHGSRQRCFFDGSQNDMGDPEEQMLKAKRCEKDEKLAKVFDRWQHSSKWRCRLLHFVWGPTCWGFPSLLPFYRIYVRRSTSASAFTKTLPIGVYLHETPLQSQRPRCFQVGPLPPFDANSEAINLTLDRLIVGRAMYATERQLLVGGPSERNPKRTCMHHAREGTVGDVDLGTCRSTQQQGHATVVWC